MPIRMDLHVHSTVSPDGTDGIFDICSEAVEKGIKVICFTEHADLSENPGGNRDPEFSKYSKLIDKARGHFGNNLKILKGVEAGEPHLHPGQFEKLLKLNFDMILGSVHWIGNHFVGENDLERLYSREQIFEMYFIELFRAVEFGGFDSIAHFDLPKRYFGAPAGAFGPGDMESEILECMRKKGIALELNSSSLRKDRHEPMPGIGTVRKYGMAGGSMITTGSDSHAKKDLGSGFDVLLDMIRSIPGLKSGYFEGRKFKETL